MEISRKTWNNYIKRMSAIDRLANKKMKAFLEKNGIPKTYEASQNAIKYANGLVMKYGEASSALACEMYDLISEMEEVVVPAAEPAKLPTYGEVAKSVNGTIKLENAEIVAGAVERLVKMPGADTMLKNATRDNAEYAWIPNGDTCAFCLTLASRGWQHASKAMLQGGHAEHIHGHCDCTFAIRHNADTKVQGYDPNKYLQMYEDADISSAGYDADRPQGQKYQSISTARINGMRREFYKKNKERINAQKRSAYAKRKELNSSSAEELKV